MNRKPIEPINILASEMWAFIISAAHDALYRSSRLPFELSPRPFASTPSIDISVRSFQEANEGSCACFHFSAIRDTLFFRDGCSLYLQPVVDPLANLRLGIDIASSLANQPDYKEAVFWLDNSLDPSISRKLSTYDRLTGCSDLALCLVARRMIIQTKDRNPSCKVFPESAFLSDRRISGAFTQANRRHNKNCFVWLSPAVDVTSKKNLNKLISKISGFYNVFILPGSLDSRSETFSRHIEFARSIAEEVCVLASLPGFGELISLPHNEDDLFISDLPHAGWMFGSMGMNTLFLAREDSGQAESALNGYSQYLRLPINKNISLHDTINSIELAAYRRKSYFEICKIHARSLFCEILSLICEGT